jgi:Protein of unknown function (DUF2726)
LWLGYTLLALLPIAAVAWIAWEHRRQAERREAQSTGRMEELLGVAMHAAPAATPAPTPAPDVPAAAASDGTPASPYVLRSRLLTPPQTVLYYLLKIALPDHAVFAQMSVAAVLDCAPNVAPYAREEQARIFARHVIDFVIADRSTHVVAVVKLVHSGEFSQSVLSSLRTWFAAAGVRYVEIDAARLPRKESVRAVVLGAPADAEHAHAETEKA